MAKGTSYEAAVRARVPGSTESGPWLACDGRLARHREQRVELIDPRTGAVTGSFEQASLRVVVASGAPTVVRERDRALEACGLDGVARVRLAGTGQRSFGGPRPLAVSPDGSLVAGTHDGRILWDARTGECVVAEADRSAGDAAFSPDGRVVAFTHGGRPATLVEVDGWKSRDVAGFGTKGRMIAPAFSPSGRRVAFALGRKLLVVDRASGEPPTELKFTRDAFALAWLDEDALAVAARSSLVVLRAGDGAELGVLPIRCTALAVDRAVTTLACAVDGVWARGLDDLEIVLLDVPALLALLRAAPAAEPKKKKPAKPRKPPAHGCVFGVPAAVPVDRIVKAAEGLHSILDRRPEEFALLTQPEGEVASLRWFAFAGSRGRRYLLDPWIESLVLDLGELTVALRCPLGARFERYEGGRLSPSTALVSDGRGVRSLAGGPVEGDDAIDAGLARCSPGEPAGRYLSALRGGAVAIRGGGDASGLVNMLDLVAAHQR